MQVRVAARRRRGRTLTDQGRRGQLAARIAVSAVVQHNDGDPLAAHASMHDLSHAYGGKIAIALEREDGCFPACALDPGSTRRGAPLQRGEPREVERPHAAVRITASTDHPDDAVPNAQALD